MRRRRISFARGKTQFSERRLSPPLLALTKTVKKWRKEGRKEAGRYCTFPNKWRLLMDKVDPFLPAPACRYSE